jgi:hypothetical protein
MFGNLLGLQADQIWSQLVAELMPWIQSEHAHVDLSACITRQALIARSDEPCSPSVQLASAYGGGQHYPGMQFWAPPHVPMLTFVQEQQLPLHSHPLQQGPITADCTADGQITSTSS